MADPCSHDISLHISTSARFRGIPHVGRRALFPRHSCREIPGDVTRAPSLQPARAYRPGNPLRVFISFFLYFFYYPRLRHLHVSRPTRLPNYRDGVSRRPDLTRPIAG